LFQGASGLLLEINNRKLGKDLDNGMNIGKLGNYKLCESVW